MDKIVDLHTHTSVSDGSDSPAELVRKAANAGLAAVAVTDHETVAGLKEAVEAGVLHGIEVVRGCELAVSSPYGEAHILGLWLSSETQGLEEAFARIREARNARNQEMVERFRRAGYDVSYDELLGAARGESVGRPHMARLLVQKGVCASAREAFCRFLGDDKPMYAPRDVPTPAEGLALLKREGATTVFAHPMLLKAPPEGLALLIDDMVGEGLDAIEAYHPEHDARATRRALSFAKRYGLALSGGSDYHGDARPDTRLGTGKGDLRVSLDVLENLRAVRRRQGLPAGVSR